MQALHRDPQVERLVTLGAAHIQAYARAGGPADRTIHMRHLALILSEARATLAATPGAIGYEAFIADLLASSDVSDEHKRNVGGLLRFHAARSAGVDITVPMPRRQD